MTGPAKPLPLTRLLYRLRLTRLGVEWADWVEQDMAAPSFVFWSAAANVVLMGIAAASFTVVFGEFPVTGVVVFLVVSLGVLLFPGGRRWVRRRDLNWHRRKWGRPEAP